MKRNALAALLATILAACGSLTAVHPESAPAPINAATPAASSLTSTPTPSSPQSAAAYPPAASPPAAAATAVAAGPTMLTRTVALIAIGGSRTNGFVELTDRNGSFVATVSAGGLAPGLHTVHIHRGSCANPYAGMHLTVLGILAANASGAGTLVAGLGSVYLSPANYLIVYATTSPQVIVGCAGLVALG